jgi:hypothetical protein
VSRLPRNWQAQLLRDARQEPEPAGKPAEVPVLKPVVVRGRKSLLQRLACVQAQADTFADHCTQPELQRLLTDVQLALSRLRMRIEG